MTLTFRLVFVESEFVEFLEDAFDDFPEIVDLIVANANRNPFMDKLASESIEMIDFLPGVRLYFDLRKLLDFCVNQVPVANIDKSFASV